MGLADLPTMAEVAADRVGKPIPKGATRLDTKVASATDDAKQLETWKRAVRLRDKGRCRVCGIQTVKTLELDPKRGEAHHVAGRADRAVRYDVRNGLHCCLACHGRFKARTLFILQAAKHAFTVGVKTYLNASKHVTFSRKAAA